MLSNSGTRREPEPAGTVDLRRQLFNLYMFVVGGVLLLAFILTYWFGYVRSTDLDAPPPDPQNLLLLMMIIIVIITVILGFLFWIVTLYRFVRPIDRLVDVSEAIRWRGYLLAKEQETLASLVHEPGQVGILAQSIQAMEAENNRRFRELNVLLDNSRVVASSLDVDEVIGSILGQIETVFGVERCAILTLDERAGSMRMIASLGMGDYASLYNSLPTDPQIPSLRALEQGRPIQVSDTENDFSSPHVRERARQIGFRSTLAIPMQTREAAPAVLVLYKNEPYYYSYRELELAASFANQASLALENAALYALVDERLQEQTRRLEAIVESLRDGLILESLTGEVLYCNRQAAEILGFSVQDIRHKNVAAILHPLVDPHLISRQGEYQIEIERQNPRKNLRIYFFDVTDERGEMIGRGQLWQDITHDRELDRMKSALVSTVSHELRTPLATIKGYATTLLADDVEWDLLSQREFLGTISSETDRLTLLVKSLLDMSRIEGGTLRIRQDAHNLNDLLYETVKHYSAERQAQIRLKVGELPPVSLDFQRISTVIRNLIDNALKYGTRSTITEIEVETGRENGSVYLTVRDYGDGIAPEYHKHIFEQFFRVDSKLSREIGGIGLGLAICKGFVEAHNGRIWVIDAKPGSKFGFELPI